MSASISVTKTTSPKDKPKPGAPLPFGKFFTDHMFVVDYVEGKGWIHPRIEPYAPFLMEPSAAILHYAQATFEGMKAYHCSDKSANLFRPRINFERMNRSNERMVIPTLDVDFCVEATRQLIQLDRDWIPQGEGESLYIRPFVFAVDPFLGVRPALTYRFMIILSPSGAYYQQGMNPVSIYVENDYVRAVRGGTGYTKCAGNYAASLAAQKVAHQKGCIQVLWLDALKRTYVEEVGSMNIVFIIDNKFVTPKLSGTIMPGVTRRSCIEYAQHLGIEVEERDIAIDDVIASAKTGRLSESFGTGTAAVISPVGKFCFNDEKIVINNNEIGPMAQMFYDVITGIQTGRRDDLFGWTVKV